MTVLQWHMLPFPWKHSHLFPSISQPWNWIDHPISKCREYVYTRAADGKCLTLFIRIRHVRQVVLLVIINHQFRYYIAIPEINTLTHFISFIYKKNVQNIVEHIYLENTLHMMMMYCCCCLRWWRSLFLHCQCCLLLHCLWLGWTICWCRGRRPRCRGCSAERSRAKNRSPKSWSPTYPCRFLDGWRNKRVGCVPWEERNTRRTNKEKSSYLCISRWWKVNRETFRQ